MAGLLMAVDGEVLCAIDRCLYRVPVARVSDFAGRLECCYGEQSYRVLS